MRGPLSAKTAPVRTTRMKLLINYADAKFARAQDYNAATGRSIGGFDEVRRYGPRDIDDDFQQRNRAILTHPAGAGYWLWKPYFIFKALRDLKEDDYLFYADSGSFFVHSIDPLIETARRLDQAVVYFENMRVEKRWTKRDAFVLMDCDEPRHTESPQRQGGFSLWRKSAAALAFAEECLTCCQDERLITDMPNQMGKPDYPEFVAHRHDQSISSLLAKKRGLRPFRMITQDGKPWKRDFPECAYPQLVKLTRRGHLPLRKRVWWSLKARWAAR